MAAILGFFASVIVGSIIVTAWRSPLRGTGGPSRPPVREKPSADEPTPGRSDVTDQATAQRAQQKTPRWPAVHPVR